MAEKDKTKKKGNKHNTNTIEKKDNNKMAKMAKINKRIRKTKTMNNKDIIKQFNTIN